MSIVILDAMENGSSISAGIAEQLRGKEEGSKCFRLREMKVLPCRSCDACSYKSPGKCVAKDDMHEIMQAIARCSTVVMLTPVTFGGYTSSLKKVVDKFMHLCMPTYAIENGHLVHPARYGRKSLVVIGVYGGDSEDQRESFKRVVEHNSLNLQYAARTLIVNPSEAAGEIQRQIGCMIEEVC